MSGCPSSERLKQFLERRLHETERRAIEEHAATCATCRETLASLEGEPDLLAAWLRLAEETPLDPDGERRFLERLEQTAPSPGKAPTPAVPGYEILEKLGQGGMGVVWKARQIKADRLVALKMIKGFAGEEELQRFGREARAIASLQDPHIVQIYEVGEHDTQPFFSLEYCPGGSLDKKLGGTPLPPEQAAATMEALARAMAVAHQKGVVHRDLKPGNVLLDEHGQPKVTDFGLAKKVDEAGQTVAGAVQGTPSYMAREQAEGSTLLIGPPTDVYALGAILYECLTGRPPFKAATVQATLLQVIADEPVPPRRLQSATPRDLDTICLKCLEKEQGRRYASALDLAEDLRRFRAGEPIAARPVAPLGRAVKWARRRPAVAGLLALFVLSLLAGTGVSTYFAVVANNRAEQAEKSDLAAKAALAKSQETLAVSLLRPIGHHRDPIKPIELSALWELATLPKGQDRVRIRFIERALRTPETAEQLERRSAIAVHAAVGLDPQRRKEVLELLLPRLRDKVADLRIRTACAAAVAALAPPDEDYADSAAEALVEALVEALGKSTNQLRFGGSGIDAVQDLVRMLAAVVPQMHQQLAEQAAQKILDVMVKATLPAASGDLSGGQYYSDATRVLAEALGALAPRMNELKAEEAAQKLVVGISGTTNLPELITLTRALRVVAARLGEDGADKAAQKILDTMAKPAYWIAFDALAEALAAVGARMRENKAQEAANNAAETIIDAMAKKTPQLGLTPCLRGLAVLAVRLHEAHADKAARTILDMMTNPRSKDVVGDLPKTLAHVAPRMSPAASVATLVQILDTIAKTPRPPLLNAMADVLYSKAMQLLAEASGALASRMGPDAAGKAAQQLRAAIAKRNQPGEHPFSFAALSQALGAVALHMHDKEAQDVADEAGQHILRALASGLNRNDRRHLARALAAVAPRMSPGFSGAAMPGIVAAMARAPDPVLLNTWNRFDYFTAMVYLGRAFSAVAPRLPHDKVPNFADRVARNIVLVMVGPANRRELGNLSETLGTVAPWMHGNTANDAAKKILGSMANSTDKDSLQGFAAALGALGPLMDQAVADAAAQKTLDVMVKTADSFQRSNLAEALGAVTSRMEAGAAAARILDATILLSVSYQSQSKKLADTLRAALPKLSRQELVNLLKHPGCVGWTKKIVLGQLRQQVSQRFETVWELVDRLAAHAPEIDLSSPPTRSQRP